MLHTLQELASKYIYYTPKESFIPPNYFLDERVRTDYAKNGFAVIKQVVPEQSIKCIMDAYNHLREQSGFQEAPGFITSPNYGAAAQQLLSIYFNSINKEILPNVFHIDSIEYDFFSLLVIKYNQDKGYVQPHQDISIVEEDRSTTTFLWIPTGDIDEKNGAMLVLPGSHLWGRWQKTHNRTITPILNNANWLLSKMTPIYIKKGDLIAFDSSLIHGSMPNTSSKVRIAMNTSIIPANSKMVHYEISPFTPAGFVDKYYIDRNFWENACYIESIANNSYYKMFREPLRLNKSLSTRNLDYLDKLYNPLQQNFNK